MKVLVNALGAEKGGAMRHLTNFLPALAEVDPSGEYVVLVRSSFDPREGLTPNIRLEYCSSNVGRSWTWRLLHDLWVLPRKLRREGFDVVVSLTNLGPIWSPVAHVFFQRNALFYCPYYLKSIHGKDKLETALRRALAIASMARADVTVTPSNSMSDMIRDACPSVRERRFATLYHGFDQDSFAEPLNPAIDAKIVRLPKPLLLYPSHIVPYKGLEIIFNAVAELRSRGLPVGLVVAGHPDDWPPMADSLWELLRTLGLEQLVAFLGGVPQRQMGALYRACDVMVNPSLCESFGFSTIEALGHGLPIVAADLPINREICGTAARYYPPLDPRRAADQIAEVIGQQDRSEMRDAATRQLSQFDWSWRRYAREFVSLIDSVAGERRDKLADG